MAKILDASCNALGVVSSEGVSVAEAVNFGEGTKESTGALFLDKDKAYYFTSNASDIKKLIEDLVVIINQIATISSGLDAVTNSPGAQAANITQLQTLKTQLEATKGTLK